MPVRKFSAVELVPPPPCPPALHPDNLKLACDLSTTAARLRPRRFPPGLYRHASLADADRLRQQWESGPPRDTG
jgi:hypothetical protein